MKKIYLVYQDCALCGDKGKKRKAHIQKISKDYGIEVVKMSFVHPWVVENKIFTKAIQQGKGAMPFYTDGEKVSADLMDFVEKPVEKSAEVVEKAQKVRAAKTTRRRKTSKKAS